MHKSVRFPSFGWIAALAALGLTLAAFLTLRHRVM